MLPTTMTMESLIPRDIVAQVVFAVDNRKTVQLHGNDEQVLDRVKAMVAMFVGGGHA